MFRSIIDKKLKSRELLNYDLNYNEVSNIIMKTLKKGLGDRVSILTCLPDKLLEWELSSNNLNFEKLFIGLHLNPDFAFNIIEKGPAANLKEVRINFILFSFIY